MDGRSNNGGARPGAGRPPGTGVKTAATLALEARAAASVNLSADHVLDAILMALAFDIRTLEKPNGRLKRLSQLSRAEAFMVSGFEYRRGGVIKVRVESRIKWAELAARALGMLQDNLNVSGDWERLEARLKAARLVESSVVVPMPAADKAPAELPAAKG